MKKDIESRGDIEHLLGEFYAVAIVDPEIGHHFADLDLDAHLPVITDFWEKILFGEPVYFGNPLLVHQKLNKKFLLKSEHFTRWVKIFNETVSALFEGETAQFAMSRAKMIAANLDQHLSGGIRIQDAL